MEIGSTPQLLQSTILTLSEPAIKSWQVGQLLNAILLEATSAGNIDLKIGNITLQASGNLLNAVQGQHLKLEVIRTDPKPELRIVTTTPATEEPVAEVLKVLLPRQLPLTPLLANLSFLMGEGSRTLPALPRQLDQTIKKMIGDLPDDKKISNADGLKRALSLSGMFLERKMDVANHSMAQDGSEFDQDFKANLLRLMFSLKQNASSKMPGQPTIAKSISTSSTPPLAGKPLQGQQRNAATVNSNQSSVQIIDELLQQANGAIARLQVNQVSSLPNDDNLQQVLSFELPIRHEDRIDVVQIRIFQDRTATHREESHRWSASLALAMESLGTVYATITISQQQVWTSIWAERKATVEIVSQHLQDLYSGYIKAGLKIGATQCFHGTPPPAVKNAHTILVDSNA